MKKIIKILPIIYGVFSFYGGKEKNMPNCERGLPYLVLGYEPHIVDEVKACRVEPSRKEKGIF